MSKLPRLGQVFALEVAPRVDVLVRVVAAVGNTRCVVMTKASTLGSPRLFEVQAVSHHQWNRPTLGAWVSGPPPASLRALGVVRLRELEKVRVVHPQTWVKLPKKDPQLAAKVLPLSGWGALVDEARSQWRWDNERAIVLAEEARRERENQMKFEAALAAAGKRKATLHEKGVASLKKTRFFGAWKGVRAPALIKEAEEAMREAVLSLEGKTTAQAVKRLAKLVQAFNALDERHGKTFDSADREDVMEAIATIALACAVADDVFEEVVEAQLAF